MNTKAPVYVPDAIEMGEFAAAIRDCGGWTPELLKIAKGKLPQIRDVLNGSVRVQVGQFVVDGDTPPPIPCANWTLKRHAQQGPLNITVGRDDRGAVVDLFINGRKIVLVQTPQQTAGKHVSTADLMRHICSADVPNVNVLVALLGSPYLCPRSWKEMNTNGVVPEVFFMGTEYTEGVARHVVLSARWNGMCFEYSRRYLADPWVPEDFIATLEPAAST